MPRRRVAQLSDSPLDHDKTLKRNLLETQEPRLLKRPWYRTSLIRFNAMVDMSTAQRRSVLQIGLGALASASWPSLLTAQTTAYPQRVVKFIVPNAPGSSIDTIGRILSNQFATSLAAPNQPAAQVVIENKAGAAGALGLDVGRAAAADGYTLMLASSSSMTVAPLIQKAVKYDPLKDFDLLALVALLPNVLVCTNALPVTNMAEFLTYAKAKKGSLNMASAGLGSVSHLAGVAFSSSAGFESLHVPYKAGGQSATAVVSGESHWTLTPAPNAMSLVKAGRLRALGHSMAKGLAPIDDLPSIGDTVNGFEYVSWIGLVGPKGISATTADAIRRALVSSLQQAALKDAFTTNGAVPPPASLAGGTAFRDFLSRDIELNRRVIRVAAVPIE